MGNRYTAICEKCGDKFEVNNGGGFFFHLLHCDQCGKEKSISFDELGDIHLRYVKGLSVPYCMVSAEKDKRIQEEYPGTPLSEDEYHAEVERMAGQCHCGGEFKFDASPRCPKCKSAAFSEDPDGEYVMYD